MLYAILLRVIDCHHAYVEEHTRGSCCEDLGEVGRSRSKSSEFSTNATVPVEIPSGTKSSLRCWASRSHHIDLIRGCWITAHSLTHEGYARRSKLTNQALQRREDGLPPIGREHVTVYLYKIAYTSMHGQNIPTGDLTSMGQRMRWEWQFKSTSSTSFLLSCGSSIRQSS